MAIYFKPFEELFAPEYQSNYIDADGNITVGLHTYSVFIEYTMQERQVIFQVCEKYLPWEITQEQEQWERTMYMYQFIIKSPSPFPYSEYKLRIITEVKSNKTFACNIGRVALTIGNDKITDEFQSHIKFKFWDEDELTLEKTGLKGDSVLTNDKVSLEFSALGMDWYKDGNDLKWIFRLKSKPLTNTYSLQLGGNWQDFNFWYQTPFINPEKYISEQDGEEWLKIGSKSRPHRVDGSYAVYHKTKKHHITGQKNYRTGKVLHIYVPKATDSIGKSAWCELHIENGVYTVTIPQAFLDTAVYPVTINDTLGDESGAGGSTDTMSAQELQSFYIGDMPQAGTLDSISVYDSDISAVAGVIFGLYSGNAGVPATFIMKTTATTKPGGAQYHTGTAGSEVLGNGLEMYPAIATQNNSDIQINFDITGGFWRGIEASSYDVPDPPPAWDFSETDEQVSAYITYAPTGAPAGNAAIMTTNTGFWGATF